jgi:hypothetical protein
MRSSARIFITLLSLFLTTLNAQAQTLKSDYLRYLKIAADRGWADAPAIIERWKRETKPSELWGYDAPAHPIYLADLLGFLYQ